MKRLKLESPYDIKVHSDDIHFKAYRPVKKRDGKEHWDEIDVVVEAGEYALRCIARAVWRHIHEEEQRVSRLAKDIRDAENS